MKKRSELSGLSTLESSKHGAGFYSTRDRPNFLSGEIKSRGRAESDESGSRENCMLDIASGLTDRFPHFLKHSFHKTEEGLKGNTHSLKEDP